MSKYFRAEIILNCVIFLAGMLGVGLDWPPTIAVALGLLFWRAVWNAKQAEDGWKLVELATDTMAKTNRVMKAANDELDAHFHSDGSVHVLWERKDKLN